MSVQTNDCLGGECCASSGDKGAIGGWVRLSEGLSQQLRQKRNSVMSRGNYCAKRTTRENSTNGSPP